MFYNSHLNPVSVRVTVMSDASCMRVQAVDHGIKTSSRTVIVLSRQFLTDIWPCMSDVPALRGDTSCRHTSEIIVVIVNKSQSDVPPSLLDQSVVVDASCHYDQWWHKLTSLITSPHLGTGTPRTRLSVYISLAKTGTASLTSARL